MVNLLHCLAFRATIKPRDMIIDYLRVISLRNLAIYPCFKGFYKTHYFLLNVYL